MTADSSIRTSNNQRTGHQQTQDASPSENICPECDGQVVFTAEQEYTCEDCGLVVDENNIDRGPEHSRHDDTTPRTGRSTTPRLHDKGLSTEIGWENRDSHGNTLSSEQRSKARRLRRWNQRYSNRDHLDRNLRQALGEIDRMAASLGLPTAVRETASVIYRRALEEDLVRGYSIEAVASAALLAASRQHAQRSIRELVPCSRVDQQAIRRAHRNLNEELGLELPPPDPCDHLDRYASDLGFSQQTVTQAADFLEGVKAAGKHSGKDPVALAAGALYAAQLFTRDHATQARISDSTDVSEVSIRKHYQRVLKCNGIEPATVR
jgi:transcription initiation factor TFIIB